MAELLTVAEAEELPEGPVYFASLEGDTTTVKNWLAQGGDPNQCVCLAGGPPRPDGRRRADRDRRRSARRASPTRSSGRSWSTIGWATGAGPR
jgi:hypothetical protein